MLQRRFLILYFQKLEKSNKVNGSLKDLDRYLASLLPFYARKINPLIFANAFGYSKDMTIKLFNEAVTLGVLEIRYLIVDSEYNPVKSYKKYDEIPRELYSEELDKKFETTVDNIQIWYELIERPKEKALDFKPNSIAPLTISNIAADKDSFATLSDSLGF